jgi:hypothetical protein
MTSSIEEQLEKRAIGEFVTLARQCFPPIYPNQNFDASHWDYSHLLKSSTRRSDRSLFYVRHQPGMTKKSVLEAEVLPAYFSDIVKSILVLHSNSLIHVRLTSFRILWEWLLVRFGGNGDAFRWHLLREADVLNAEQRMKALWADSTVYVRMSALILDLQRLAERNIFRPLSVLPETPCPKYANKHTLEGNESALAKLPSAAVLEGLADIYAARATSPPDRLFADILAILAVTGLRIDEVLTLSADCLVLRTLNSRKYVGLRISKKKSPNRAEEDHVLWLTPIQSALVVPAIEEARSITTPARDRASELEKDPNRIPLPNLNWSDELSAVEAAALIGFSDCNVVNRISEESLPRRLVGGRFSYRVTDIERYLMSRRKDLWILMRADGTKQMLSESLFVVFRNFVGTVGEGKGSRRTLRFLVEPITQQQVRAFLTGIHLKDGSVQQRSTFERFDMRDPHTGKVLRMHPHQCRHWVTHNAVRGGMPIRHMARWHGREKVDDVFTYTHMTSSERIEWVRHKIESNELQGPFIDYYFSLADEVKDLFLEGRLAAIHVTHMGLCLHDFTLAPCPNKLACLSGNGCPEYVFDPSDSSQRANLVQLVGRTKTALDQAKAKVETPGLHLAESWVQDAQTTVDNAERILSNVTTNGTSMVRPFVGQRTKFIPISRA